MKRLRIRIWYTFIFGIGAFGGVFLADHLLPVDLDYYVPFGTTLAWLFSPRWRIEE